MSLFQKIAGMSVLSLALTLTACDNSGAGNSNADNGNDNPDMEAGVEFAEFVKDEIENTSANSEATAVNEVMFEFNNKNNESAFDELFQ